MRFSSGITRRANAVVSSSMPERLEEIEAAVDEVERRSAERWLAPTFQQWRPLGDKEAETGTDTDSTQFFEDQRRLAAVLERRGYVEVAPTEVLWMDRANIPTDTPWDPRVLVNETLTDEWLDAYMDHAGGGVDAASRVVYRRLLGGGRNRFYSYVDDQGRIGALAKASLVPGERSERRGVDSGTYAGIYALWVREDLRGQGLSAVVMDAILNHLLRLGVSGAWMQVGERSTRALSVYQAAGFIPVARYRYLTMPV
ncbi:GNAT family N-acetyltransferase [Citricoccus sp. GCM10030269]|uniref:GNAT family N-acetyltransferase n=1 Tax=Citricoccus sp. GCM10030269 TaxID=3273388 RepID=UPI0036208B0A